MIPLLGVIAFDRIWEAWTLSPRLEVGNQGARAPVPRLGDAQGHTSTMRPPQRRASHPNI
eukprot:3833813-Pyramimonas_sp.AAC.1